MARTSLFASLIYGLLTTVIVEQIAVTPRIGIEAVDRRCAS
jgi:hypothetical protein